MAFFRIRTVLYRVIVSDIDRKLCGGAWNGVCPFVKSERIFCCSGWEGQKIFHFHYYFICKSRFPGYYISMFEAVSVF